MFFLENMGNDAFTYAKHLYHDLNINIAAMLDKQHPTILVQLCQSATSEWPNANNHGYPWLIIGIENLIMDMYNSVIDVRNLTHMYIIHDDCGYPLLNYRCP